MVKKRKHNYGRQIDQRGTKQVRIDAGWHRELKILGARHGKTLRELVEQGFPETLAEYESIYTSKTSKGG